MKLSRSIRVTAAGLASTGAALTTIQPVVMEQPLAFAETIEATPTLSVQGEAQTLNLEHTGGIVRYLSAESPKWDAVAKTEFAALSRKLALDLINSEEMIQFKRLQELRRRGNSARTFDEIQMDIEGHRAVEAAIAGLQQLIAHATRPYPTEA